MTITFSNKPIDIVPRDFKQTRLQDDATVKTVTKTIYGQKVPLPQLVTAIMTDMHNRGFLAAANINATTSAEEEVERPPQGTQRFVSRHTGGKTGAASDLKMQTTVNLSNWGDHSSLSAHGYLLYTVRPMYDPAVFFNTSISATDMQQEVEKPQIYLFAMSR